MLPVPAGGTQILAASVLTEPRGLQAGSTKAYWSDCHRGQRLGQERHERDHDRHGECGVAGGKTRAARRLLTQHPGTRQSRLCGLEQL